STALTRILFPGRLCSGRVTGAGLFLSHTQTIANSHRVFGHLAFFGHQRSVKWLTHLFRLAPLKSAIATSIWRQEGYMAPKPKPPSFVFPVGMVLAMPAD